MAQTYSEMISGLHTPSQASSDSFGSSELSPKIPTHPHKFTGDYSNISPVSEVKNICEKNSELTPLYGTNDHSSASHLSEIDKPHYLETDSNVIHEHTSLSTSTPDVSPQIDATPGILYYTHEAALKNSEPSHTESTISQQAEQDGNLILTYEQPHGTSVENQGQNPINESPYLINSNNLGKPKTPYNEFLQKLKHPSCLSIVTEIKSFVETHGHTLTPERAATRLHQFMSLILDSLLQLEIFMKDEPLQLLDKLEKFIIQKLYSTLLNTFGSDSANDKSFLEKIMCLDWVELSHLELDYDFDVNIISSAINEIKRLDRMKCPRDKLVLILNCCRAIVSLLEGENYSKSSARFASADEILPLLIYIIIKANPKDLKIQIEFIQIFRHPALHIKEEAYFFTQFSSAVLFISNLGDSTQLHISDEEFNRYFTMSMEKHQISNIKLPILTKNFKTDPTEFAPITASNRDQRAADHVIDSLYEVASNMRGKYEQITDIEDLKLNEIRQIISEYNELTKLRNMILKAYQ